MLIFKVALAILSLQVLTSASTSADAQSCRQASHLVSCQTKVKVDPSSYATCCYNGALQKGYKESGLVLATQFYDTDPSIGPKDSTTIHGLWPDYCDGTYPQYCTKDSGIPEYSGAQIAALLQKYDPKLLEYMRIYYKSNDGNDESFWEHEYNKHGTCFTTLRAKCQSKSYHGANQSEAAVIGYFEEIVRQFRQLPTVKWLAQAGITPSPTKMYSLESIQQALSKKHGGVPYVGCKSGNILNEFWYFSHTEGPLVGGHYLPLDSTAPSSCSAQVSFPPK